jgi:hypothetical protein
MIADGCNIEGYLKVISSCRFVIDRYEMLKIDSPQSQKLKTDCLLIACKDMTCHVPTAATIKISRKLYGSESWDLEFGILNLGLGSQLT